MATYFVEACSVCTDEYDYSHRQSVLLPCGHDFCLSCLVRLRAKGKHKCPRCRANWAKIGLPIPSEMEAVATALESDQDDEEDVGKKKDTDDRCKKHSSPYDFWVNAKKEFYCRKCAAEDRSGVELDVIEEAIPQIKAALAADVPEAKRRLEDEVESLDERHANLVKKRNSVRKFSKAVKALEDDFDQEIEQVAAQRTKALNSTVELKKVEKKILNITSPADVGVAMECKNTLKSVGLLSSVPASDLHQTLLCGIACSYEEEATSESPPSKAAFVNSMLKGTSVGLLSDEDWSASSSAKKKSSKQNKKAGTRNKSKDRSRRDRSNSDEEGRNESVDRSARSSSESVPARPRIQYKWQYEDDHGWTTYGQIPSPRNSSGAKTVTSDDIELHYLEDEERCPLVIEINNVQYQLDFKKMTQTNQKTRKRRTIRRIIKNTMDDHSARGQTNLSRNSSENSCPAPVHGDVTNFTSHPRGSNSYSASNNLLTDRSNNYAKHRSTNTSANDFSVKHVWQFEDEYGKWITYGKSNFVFDIKKATTSDDIEKVYSKDPSRAIMRIQRQCNQYILDFRKMTQTNEQTEVQRKVRRVPEHATNTSLAEKVKPFAGSLVGGKEYINFEWQFEDEVGVWITFGQANSAGMSHCTTTVTSSGDIEKYYNSLPKKVMMTIKSSTNDYVLDFDTMTQTNEKTSVQRRIRRIPKISRDNMPHNDFSSSSSSGFYPNLTVFNSALGNPNSAPSYAMTAAYGGSHSTHGQGGGYSSHGSGAGNMPESQRGAGGGYSSHGSDAGNMLAIHIGAGGRVGGFNGNGSGAGNIHPIPNVAGGRGGGYYDHDIHRIRPAHSQNQSLFIWQFMDEKGFWITYGHASSTGFSSGKTVASSHDIERHFVATNGQQPMKIKTPLNDYELDFVYGVQVNTTTGARKHIRRVPL